VYPQRQFSQANMQAMRRPPGKEWAACTDILWSETTVRIPELYASKRPVFSFEFFPPRSAAGAEKLLETVRQLASLAPDFVSVTCPGEIQRRPLTFELVVRIKRELGIEGMAHLVTVDYEREAVGEILSGLRDQGIENVLTLRGDLPEDRDPGVASDFPHASDLAAFALPFGFSVGGAAHPERHPESPDWESEIRYARKKVEAGCSFLVTQLFFDNADYFRFVERARDAGITVPIVPGIMPVTSLPGIRRMAAMNGNRIPDALTQALQAVEDDPTALRAVGVEWATRQCEELLAREAPGIHFYTLNRSPATRSILRALRGKG